MKVLITGASGQLGREVMKKLTQKGFEAVGTYFTGASAVITPGRSVSDMPRSYVMDITDCDVVFSLFRQVMPDAVIHCAAWTDVDAAEAVENKAAVHRVNAEGTENVAKAAKSIGAKLVYISTDYVFGGAGDNPWKPDDKCFAPLNYYGMTKLEGEVAVAEYMDRFFIVRISWLFGTGGRNFISTMINAGRKHDTVRVVNDQFGTPTYARDLAGLLAEMIKTDKYGYYHVTNSETEPGGMFVKLGFSVAFHLDSEIMIMDEVLAVGDMAFQQKCISSLKSAAKNDDRTVLYVSHNMNTVRELCDRCVVIDKGRVVFDGETDKAIAVYLGTRDLMPAEIRYGARHRPDDRIIRAYKRFSMDSLRLINRTDPVFYSTDEAIFEMECTAEEPLKDLGLRFELWYQDGTKVATALSGNFVSLEPGPNTIQIRLPMRHLASGQYRADIVAFLFDGSRNENKIDAVYPGFSFQIESSMDSDDYLEWNHRFWGVIRLDDAVLEKK